MTIYGSLFCKSVCLLLVGLIGSSALANPLLKAPPPHPFDTIAQVLENEQACEGALHDGGTTVLQRVRESVLKKIAEKVATLQSSAGFEGQTLADGANVPRALYIQFSKDMIASARDEANDLMRELSHAWSLMLNLEVERRYQNNIKAASSNHVYGGLPGFPEVIPQMPSLLPFLARVIANPQLVDALPRDSRHSDLRKVLQGNGNLPLNEFGRYSLKNAKEVERQLGLALLNVFTAQMQAEVTAHAERLIKGAPTIEERFIAASVDRDADGKSTGRIDSWQKFLGSDPLPVVQAWYQELGAILDRYFQTLATDYSVSVENAELSADVTASIGHLSSIMPSLQAEALAEARDHVLKKLQKDKRITDAQAALESVEGQRMVEAHLRHRSNKLWAAESILKGLHRYQAMSRDWGSASTVEELARTLFSPDGLTLTLKSLPIQMQYNKVIGTTEMIPTTGEAGGNNTYAKTSIGVLFPGAGTNKSSVASLRALIPLLSGYGYHSQGSDTPDRGIGMHLEGNFLEIIEYFKILIEHSMTVRHKEAGSGENHLSRIAIGRSMGGIELPFLMLLSKNLPLEVVVGQSPSVWPSLEPQIEGILKQLANGTIPGLIPLALQNASTFNRQGGSLLERVKALHPEAFKLAGAEMLLWQGDDDEDSPDAVLQAAGLPTAIPLLMQIRDQFFPLASIKPFYNRLKGHPQLAKVDPMKLEGTHFIISNDEDMTAKDVTATQNTEFQGVPDELLPKIGSQTKQALATIELKKDMIADGLPGGYDWPYEDTRRRQEVLLRERLRICGTHPDGTAVTYFEHFIRAQINPSLAKKGHRKITTASFQNTPAGATSLAARMVEDFEWAQGEMRRIVRYLKAEGYLPAEASEDWGRPVRID